MKGIHSHKLTKLYGNLSSDYQTLAMQAGTIVAEAITNVKEQHLLQGFALTPFQLIGDSEVLPSMCYMAVM